MGIYRVALSDPFPENFADWFQFTPADGISQSPAETINFFNGKMYAASNNALYYFDGVKWNFLFSQNSWKIISASASSRHLLVCEQTGNNAANKILRVDVNNQIDSLTGFGYPNEAIEANDGATWVADLYGGLQRNENGANESLYPDGPFTNDLYRLDVRKGEVFIAAGSIGSGFDPEFNFDGFYWYDGSAWHYYNQNSNPSLADSLIDIIAVAADPFSDKAYFGSMNQGGIIEFENGNINKIYKQGYVPRDNVSPFYYKISGLKFDANGNLWVAKPFCSTPVLLKTTDGKWYSFPAALSTTLPVHDFALDPANQLWMVVAGNGMLLYNPGTDLTSAGDDESKQLSTAPGNGSLPTETVNAVATDQDGLVWVGTGQGLVFFGCPTSFFTSSDCVDAQQIIVANDSTSGGYLLSTEDVTCIAIDAGNRKWVGTATDGVYLLTSDATKSIYHFTQDNSPLFSNNISDIKIDGSTGDIYMGTSVGLEVFHAEALDGDVNSCSPYVYPNPVQPGYSGQIAIKGLVNDASVKITDISGTMIYQTTALGGQAVWNGQNYSGSKAKPGVYLVFAANSDGTVSCVTKLLVL
jgi:ligand-binding sensor domain-containing protein